MGWKKQITAVGVHLFTASGLLIAGAIGMCIVAGDHRSLTAAFAWMVLATVIDATDGGLARWAQVKEVLPGIDGRRMDDLIDFLNYTFLPVALMWRSDILGSEWNAVYGAVLLASLYGFSQSDAKTSDGYFLGFPSYWNVVAFYLYFLKPAPIVTIGVLLGLAVLTLLPHRYLYPSQGGWLNRLTCLLGTVWAGALLAYLAFQFNGTSSPWLLYASLAFPIFYLGASWTLPKKNP